LVVAEITLSVMLLVGAGLLMQTFLRLQTRDSGFRSGGVAAARVVCGPQDRGSKQRRR
jgi:hypothetical protein